jgi:ppGpp synthetase/RelA/SpoT-type nucleotidyltranferase
MNNVSKNSHHPLNIAIDYDDYSNKSPSFNALLNEVVYIVSQAIAESGIKIHSIESRVKEYSSILNKFSQEADSASFRLNDIVGVRIICLFRKDLEEIVEILRKEFDLVSVDDKVSKSNDSFGYMSIHAICRLRQDVKGRRYDTLKGAKFEIQIRTLCMHAWAAISHYLDYKSETDIPSRLRKDLNALSALFFLADSQYEAIFASKEKSAEQAKEAISNVGKNEEIEINFETLKVYLKEKYHDRVNDDNSVSELVVELNDAEIYTIEKLDELLDKNIDHFKKSEMNRKTRFHAVGVVRVSLCDTYPPYQAVYAKKFRQA